MLVEAAIGDQYGAAFEYVDQEFVWAWNDGATYNLNPKHSTRGLKYTDDTQMAIAIAELMLEGLPWTKLNIASRFVRDFKRDERTGYARMFYAFLKSVKSGEEFVEKIKPDSDKSGGAMRAFPIGLYRNIDRVKTVAAIQASVTHDTPDGKAAAVASALMTHYFCYNLGPRQELPAFIKNNTDPIDGPEWDSFHSGMVGAKGWMSVQAAITALATNNNLQDVLKASIEFTGDVDTVATIALGAGSFAQDIHKNLPMSLVDGLENDKYGLDYLRWLDRQLRLKFCPFA